MGRGTLTPQEEELKKIISNNIRIKIKEEGISQAEFARRAGIPPTTLSGYVKGVTRPNAGNLQKISDTFGILKSDIDPSYKQGYSIEDWQDSQNKSSILSKITQISSKLDEDRQEKVLNFAKNERNEQEEENKKIVHLKDEQQKQGIDLADLVDDSKVDWYKWVSFDGRPLTDDVKEAMKRLLGKRLEDK